MYPHFSERQNMTQSFICIYDGKALLWFGYKSVFQMGSIFTCCTICLWKKDLQDDEGNQKNIFLNHYLNMFNQIIFLENYPRNNCTLFQRISEAAVHRSSMEKLFIGKHQRRNLLLIKLQLPPIFIFTYFYKSSISFLF